jgi:hypothetical protein
MALDCILHMGLLGLNLGMLAWLVFGREEALLIMRALLDSTASIPEPNHGLIHNLLLWVGVVAVLDSAFVLGKLTRAVHDCGLRRRARQELSVLRQQVNAAQKSLVSAKTAEDIARHLWDTRDLVLPAIEDAFRQKFAGKIAEIEAREVPQPTPEQWITRLLAPHRVSIPEVGDVPTKPVKVRASADGCPTNGKTYHPVSISRSQDSCGPIACEPGEWHTQ